MGMKRAEELEVLGAKLTLLQQPSLVPRPLVDQNGKCAWVETGARR